MLRALKVIPMILVLSTSIAIAGTGGGLPPERHEMCMRYGKLAVKAAELKKAGYDQNDAGTTLIARFEAMRTMTLAKKILDITRYVYSKPMSADDARDRIYDLCGSGKLDDM